MPLFELLQLEIPFQSPKCIFRKRQTNSLPSPLYYKPCVFEGATNVEKPIKRDTAQIQN